MGPKATTGRVKDGMAPGFVKDGGELLALRGVTVHGTAIGTVERPETSNTSTSISTNT